MDSLRTGSPPAVDRALTILEQLAQSKRGMRPSEVALRLGFPKSSTHSLLLALERRGYVQRSDKTGRYVFGSKILTLANTAVAGVTLREIARAPLAGLMHSTGLASKIGVLDHDQAVLIDQVHPSHTLAPMTWLGKRLDLHCTALGKALAAFQLRQQWNRLVTEHTFARHNDNTICSPAKFIRELAVTRERGYALDNEEFDLGMRCLAVPVFNAMNETVAAIAVTGTALEIHDRSIASLVKWLRTAAARTSKSLPLTDTRAPDQQGFVPFTPGTNQHQSSA